MFAWAPACGWTFACSAPEQRLGPVDRELLDLVDDLAAAVVPPAGIPLGVLVRRHRPDGLEDRRPGEVLRGDQLDLVALPLELLAEQRGDVGIDLGQARRPKPVEGMGGVCHCLRCYCNRCKGLRQRRLVTTGAQPLFPRTRRSSYPCRGSPLSLACGSQRSPCTGSCRSSTYTAPRARASASALVAVVARGRDHRLDGGRRIPAPDEPLVGCRSRRTSPRRRRRMQTTSGDTEVRVIAYGHDARRALKDAGAKHVKKLKLIDGAQCRHPRRRDEGASPPTTTSSYIASDAAGAAPEHDRRQLRSQTLYPCHRRRHRRLGRRAIDGEGIGIASSTAARPTWPTSVADSTQRRVRLRHSSRRRHVGHGRSSPGVAGGRSTDGRYIGIAPGARLFALDVQRGDAVLTSDIINALGWVRRERMTAGDPCRQSLALETTRAPTARARSTQAVEVVWRAGVVVVVSAGNLGATASTSHRQRSLRDHRRRNRLELHCARPPTTPGTWSSHGTTVDGFAKPELLAPGRRSSRPVPAGTALDTIAPLANHVEPGYLRMNGTSASAPQVAGAVALLLERPPDSDARSDQVAARARLRAR